RKPNRFAWWNHHCQSLNAAGIKLHLGAADLRGRNFARIDLFEARLRKADLRDSNLKRATLMMAQLRGAKLDRARLPRALLCGARVNEARLDDARLKGAILNDAWLDGAVMIGSKCRRCDFSQARLAKTIMHTADLTRARFFLADVS